MFICVCNAITERQVRDAVAAGARRLSDLQRELGVATSCGRCARMAKEYLREASPQGGYDPYTSSGAAQPYMQVQEYSRAGGLQLASYA